MGSVAIPQSVVLKVVTLACVWIVARSVSSVLNLENFGERRRVGDTFGSEVCCRIVCVLYTYINFKKFCFITDDLLKDMLFDIGSELRVPLHVRESKQQNNNKNTVQCYHYLLLT